MFIEEITDGIIDLIKKNLIAKTALTQDAEIGDTVISVYNSGRFNINEEICLIDYGYNIEGHVHYNVFEYARIKSINSTTSITLQAPLQSLWETSEGAFIQKTIGHSPLYEDNVLYGDREVIPSEDITITVEPVSVGNEWIYIQGGLSQDFKLRIIIYGKSIAFESGRRILDKYSYAVYSLLNSNLHLNVNDYDTPIIEDFLINTNTLRIENNPKNLETFIESPDSFDYVIQDNLGSTCWLKILSRNVTDDYIELTINKTLNRDFTKNEFAVIRKIGMYIYDSRADGIEFGQVSKGSAFLRASEINWFGKYVKEHDFPQKSGRTQDFTKIE
jgi:hypothetical protein